ncbi:fumarylacetoacetate hydrolase family protein [Savagea faecisuis]|uniref:Fumarylacetoacetate hydrolase family protein n=1 Tax=Savagea faecisuis TaxID=1274803 RepID=A0ABW3H0A6_9BACL
MKLITFETNGYRAIGAVLEENIIVDLHESYKAYLQSQNKYRYEEIANAFVPSNMEAFLQGGEEAMEEAKKAIAFAEHQEDATTRKLIYARDAVKFLSPVNNPEKIICVGHNYREHILEMGREIPEFPVVFAKFANTIIGPEDDIPFYPISEQLDYEAEFVFIVGKEAKNVKEEDALDYVAGYSIANDVTYRDIQRRTLEWLQGKSVDGSAPIGPWMVTSDELTDPSGLGVTLKVNGEVRQQTNTENLVFTVQKLVAFLSNLMTLKPGDVVLTGTPGGVGVAMDPPQFLKDGDVVTIEIDKVGVLENRVKAQGGN